MNGDPTNMKEAFVYDMFRFLGADASLYNYAEISVNVSYWGVYLALEGVEDSFLRRNYGDLKGALYKPGQSKGPVGDEEWEEGEMYKEDWKEFINEYAEEQNRENLKNLRNKLVRLYLSFAIIMIMLVFVVFIYKRRCLHKGGGSK